MTIDTHHHILPDFFWRETNDSHGPVGGLVPLQWSKEAMLASLRYLDTFTKVDGSWLFAERQLYVDWLEQRAMS